MKKESPLLEQNSQMKEQTLAWVRRWGDSTCDAVLDPLNQIFTLSGVEGLIAYRLVGNCVVVFGNPVCDQKDIQILVLAFQEFCKSHGYNIVYLIVSETFAKWAMENGIQAAIEFGKELFINPQQDPRNNTGDHACVVRRKLRHAIKDGVTVEEYLGNDPVLENSVNQLGETWLKSRRGPQIHTSHIRLFDDRLGKRWFCAWQGNKIVGVVVLNRLETLQGWHLNHLMIVPDAPQGTQEMLIVSAIEKLGLEDCHFLTFGATPGERLGEIIGLGKFSAWLARNVYRCSSRAFHLDGITKFWDKFDPQSKKTYLLFSRSHIGMSEIKGLLKAMNATVY